MRFSRKLCLTLLLLLSFTTFANSTFTNRKDVQLFIKEMVKQHHFSERELVNTLNQAQFQPQIIESMERPYEKKNWDVYKSLFLTAQRLNGGLAFWQANKKTLEETQKKFGVPPEIIVAIIGVETLYGERQGTYRVLDALTTLAFDYPKRAPYFKRELIEFLLLCKEHGVAATQYLGSYAGAMGKPQFMPSSYRFYAIDYSNKGRRDLINNNDDAIASVANYFHKHGWNFNEGIAQPAHLSKWNLHTIHTNPTRVNYTYQQLQKAGVKPTTAAYNHPGHAALMEFTTSDGKEYWLTYPNFFVITRYNTSPQYALVVYLLSQQLKQQWLALNSKKQIAYA